MENLLSTWVWAGGAALVAASLSVLTGAGLGTFVLPVALLIFPYEGAVAWVSVLQLLVSATVLWRYRADVDRPAVRNFGVAFVLCSGFALLLRKIGDQDAEPLRLYAIGKSIFAITPFRFCLGLSLVAASFVGFSLARRPARKHGRLGLVAGILGGLWGGLSGHPGIVRGALLCRRSESLRSFVATNAAIALIIDLIRVFLFARFLPLAAAGPLSPGLFALTFFATATGIWITIKTLEAQGAGSPLGMQPVRVLTLALLGVIGTAVCAGWI